MDDNNLVKRIKRLEQDVIDFKTKQPVGTDSVRAYTTQTNNIWDVEGTVVESYPGAGSGQVRAFVRFQADNQNIPFGSMRLIATVNGNNYQYANSSNNFNSTTVPYIMTGTDPFWTAEEGADPSILRFLVVGTGPVGTQFKYKFFVDATDTGRIYYTWNLG